MITPSCEPTRRHLKTFDAKNLLMPMAALGSLGSFVSFGSFASFDSGGSMGGFGAVGAVNVPERLFLANQWWQFSIVENLNLYAT